MKYPIKTAAISSIILIALAIVSYPILIGLVIAGVKGLAIYIPVAIILLICVALSVLYYNGFLVLAKKFSNKMLFVTSFIQIILIILEVILLLVLGGYALAKWPEIMSMLQNLSSSISNSGSSIGSWQEYIVFPAVLLVGGLLSLFYNLGILKLASQVKYAKITGILGTIVASWGILYSLIYASMTAIHNDAAALFIFLSMMFLNLIFSLAGLVYGVFLIILLFKASSDFEK